MHAGLKRCPHVAQFAAFTLCVVIVVVGFLVFGGWGLFIVYIFNFLFY
ncbi:MAG: hypothetical protein ACRC4N_14310 [Gammaproteobacteria bacterium]